MKKGLVKELFVEKKEDSEKPMHQVEKVRHSSANQNACYSSNN